MTRKEYLPINNDSSSLVNNSKTDVRSVTTIYKRNQHCTLCSDFEVVVRSVRRRTTPPQRKSSTRRRRSSLLCLSTTRLTTTARSLVCVGSVLRSRVVRVCSWLNISIDSTVVDVLSLMSSVNLVNKGHSECECVLTTPPITCLFHLSPVLLYRE